MMSERIEYFLESVFPKRHILHTSNPNSAINFYKRLGINFIHDIDFPGTRYVAAPNKNCIFELYIAGDAKVQSPTPLLLAVSNLEKKLASLGVDAQKQEDGSYAIVDPDSRVLRIYDASNL